MDMSQQGGSALPIIAMAVILVTGVLLYRARDAFYFGSRRTFWWRSALAALSLIVSCASLWLMLTGSSIATFAVPNGFGPGWRCDYFGRGAGFCVKEK
jgi:hypothetical protein